MTGGKRDVILLLGYADNYCMDAGYKYFIINKCYLLRNHMYLFYLGTGTSVTMSIVTGVSSLSKWINQPVKTRNK